MMSLKLIACLLVSYAFTNSLVYGTSISTEFVPKNTWQEFSSTSSSTGSSNSSDSSSNTPSTTALPETKIRTKAPLVFSWEKCGVDANVKITEIFVGHQDNTTFSISYDPNINSLIFETISFESLIKDIVHINDYVDTLLFILDKNGKIAVITDCHSRPTIRLESYSEFLLNIFESTDRPNVTYFKSYEEAREELMCRSEVRFKIGNILHFPNIELGLDDHIFTVNNQKITFSVTYANQSLTIWSSDSVISVIALSKSIEKSGLYVIFSKNVLQFFANCPLYKEVIGQWESVIFNDDLQLESSKKFFISSTIDDEFIKSFCTVDKFVTLKDNDTCVPIKKINGDMEYIQNTYGLYYEYLPNEEQMYKIQMLVDLNKINAASLVAITRPIFTFASRSFAPPKFFARPMAEYLNGFTDGNLNYWIGLNTLTSLLSKKTFGLRIEFEYNNEINYEEYDQIQIGNVTENYALKLTSPYPGRRDLFEQNTQPFTAVDFNSRGGLATKFNGAFWFLPHVIYRTDLNYYYCFSCENHVDSSGTAVYFHNLRIHTYVTRMQLLF